MNGFRFRILLCMFIVLGCCIPSFSQSLSLEGAVEEAVENNPRIQKSFKEWKASRASLWEGISPAYPELFVELEGVPRSSRSVDDYEVRKSGFSQSIDFPLAYLFRGQAHHAMNLERKANMILVRNEVVRDVKTAFHAYLLIGEKIKAFRKIRELSFRNMHMARVRVLAGESSPYDTLKVKVDLAEVENELMALEKALDLAGTEIQLLMGREPEELLNVVGELSFESVEYEIDSLRQSAVENHPALWQAEAGVRQSRSLRNLAWTDVMPSVHLRYFQMDVPQDLNPDRWGGELGISIPLWILLRGQGAVRRSSLMVDASRWHVIQEKRKVVLEVDRAYSRLLVARQQVSNYRDNTLKEVEELVRIATRSYEEGEMGYLEMSDALKSFNRIRVGYSESVFEYLSALADLEEAVGRPLS